MPTITVLKQDFEGLLGAGVDLAALPRELEQAKAELKGFEPETDELKIELNDTNRPDLWSPEGLARELRLARTGVLPSYPFLAGDSGIDDSGETRLEIQVDPALESIRPCVAGFVASCPPLEDAGLRSLIQSQEKLAENFGRRRLAVAIGIYRADRIRFPVHYRAADPETTRFTPLGFDQPLSLASILEEHPKGQEYGHLLRGKARYPLLVDDRGEVLSMPPVINSQALGAVMVGDSELFVEVTGQNLRTLLLAINIAACDLADRGARIRPITVHYPYDTDFGRRVSTPHDFAEPATMPIEMIEHLLGENLPDDEIEEWLRRSGYRDVKRAADSAKSKPAITATPPAYRDDILHPVDIIEDLAIARGYNAFAPILPEEFTVGRLSREERLAKRVSELMIGAGYQEVMSNILASRELLLERMNRPADDDASLVEIENVMSANYAVLRDSVVPSLLAVEAVSSKALYPHRTFEVGECAVVDSREILGTRTLLIVGALLAHPAATFSELHSTLDALLFYLGGRESESTLEPFDHPACLAGRAGRIRISERDVGWIGELNPECLERWGIGVPASAFELDLGALLAGTQGR